MKNRSVISVLSGWLSLVLIAAVCMLPKTMHAQQTTTALTRNVSSNILVQGPVSGAATGAFSGVLHLTHFAVQNGQLVAQGVLNGTVSNATGVVSTVTNQAVSLLVSSASGSCPILSLTLGPLHLNLLGVVIDLNQINLSIVAQPGNGNLLGNLLCDVSNLLNNGGGVTALAADLNSLLAAL